MKFKITDAKEDGQNETIRAIKPPKDHDGYAVVAEGKVMAVCKYYGRATVLAARFNGFVSTPAACAKAGYIPSATLLDTQKK